jgi:hypothetical protein
MAVEALQRKNDGSLRLATQDTELGRCALQKGANAVRMMKVIVKKSKGLRTDHSDAQSPLEVQKGKVENRLNRRNCGK